MKWVNVALGSHQGGKISMCVCCWPPALPAAHVEPLPMVGWGPGRPVLHLSQPILLPPAGCFQGKDRHFSQNLSGIPCLRRGIGL